FEPLTTWLAEVLTDKVAGVRLTSRLTTSPACLVGGEFDLTPQLEQMYRASGQEVPGTRRTLELNPENDLVKGLRDRVAGDEATRDDEALKDAAEILYGTAVLAEGGAPAEPAEFAAILARHLARELA
ncbi:molecular chaperone HtpG, partial [Tsukamurella pulmonis]